MASCRRQELIIKAKECGLTKTETDELEILLKEELQRDWATGQISTLGFILLSTAINVIISTLEVRGERREEVKQCR